MTTTNKLVDNFSGLKHIGLPVTGFLKPNSTNKTEAKNVAVGRIICQKKPLPKKTGNFLVFLQII
jgi:hypothetical protein